MGIDFIQKTSDTFHKSLDQSRIDLCTTDLFTLNPTQEPRAYAAIIRPMVELNAGDEVGVRIVEGKIVVLRGIDVVAEFDSLPSETTKAIIESHCEAFGKVQAVYERAHTAEITIE